MNLPLPDKIALWAGVKLVFYFALGFIGLLLMAYGLLFLIEETVGR